MGAPDVQAAIASAAPGNVELDLRDVTFIDSSGLASVIEGHLRLTAQQRRLVLVDRSPVVQRLLDLSGDRKSVVSGQSVSVRVDLGGRRIIKKKNPNPHRLRNNTNT